MLPFLIVALTVLVGAQWLIILWLCDRLTAQRAFTLRVCERVYLAHQVLQRRAERRERRIGA